MGFNAFTPVEEKLVKTLLQWDKTDVYFQGRDEYYFKDERQAGKFLREYKTWKNLMNLEVLIGLKMSFLNLKILKFTKFLEI